MAALVDHSPVLAVRGLDAGYGALRVLRDVALELHPGEVHCLAGRNGAGKTTLLKAILGLVEVPRGEILLGGDDLARLPPHQRPRHGIGYVPQGRRLFADLTIAENLEIGLMTRRRSQAVREKVLTLFPVLGGRLDQQAGTLSGGEQQMLAVARALCLEPRVLLLDEPTEGLQPSMAAVIREVVLGLRETGVATLLVEQRIDAIEALADRVSFIENGEMRETVTGGGHAALFRRYIGVGN